MASTSTQPAPPSFPCPYTAGGCPLFNTIELPKPQTPTCAGACSPAPPTPSPPSSSLKLRPISPSAQQHSAPSPARLPPIELAVTSAGYAREVPRQSTSEWNGYLEFGLSPSDVDLAPLYVPFPQRPSPPASSSRSVSGSRQGQKRSASIWDIEELVPPPPPALPLESHAKKPRTVSTSAVELPVPPSHSARQQDSFVASGLTGGFDPMRASPPSASEEGTPTNEVVTPFISKLCYLLEHPEHQPWIRWDSSGTHILIAHTKPQLLEILARYFRHTTISSFIRQLNIYGFKRVSTVQLLSILEDTPLATPMSFQNSDSTPSSISHGLDSETTTTATTMGETFSASDYSAFHHAEFWRSTRGGRSCRLGSLKPITKERGPRNRSKKAKAHPPPSPKDTSQEC